MPVGVWVSCEEGVSLKAQAAEVALKGWGCVFGTFPGVQRVPLETPRAAGAAPCPELLRGCRSVWRCPEQPQQRAPR